MDVHLSRLSVEYFDGHSSQAHRVQMWIENGMLQLAGCNTVAGLGKDTQAAGQALENAARK